MKNFETIDALYAKSRHSGFSGDCTLLQHSQNVLNCAELIFSKPSRLSNNWQRFYRLTNEQYEKFLLNLRIAALLHDIGKANEDFLTAVSSKRQHTQAFRHEHVSAILLFVPQMKSWLSSEEAKEKGVIFDVIVAAVLSHHLKATLRSDENGRTNSLWFSSMRDLQSQTVKTFFRHSDVRQLLEQVRKIIGLSDSPPELPEQPLGSVPPYTLIYSEAVEQAQRLRVRIPVDSEQNRLLIAVKAGLLISDAAGSGLVRVGKKMDAWINEALHSHSITSDAIKSSILEPRSREIESRIGRPFEFRPFQENIGFQGSRVLLLASCAAGKTLAAWKWAERICGEFEIGKVLFLYPTRGTATEGFKDYVGWAPETEIGLDHGTSQYELESIQKTPPESLRDKTIVQSEDDEKLYALGMWGRRYLSATIDQFLGFLEFQYGSLCKLPMLADAAVIVDEVHSFDPVMFTSLLTLLKHFELPVLCMTATLPKSRLAQLESEGRLKVYAAEEDEKLKEQSCHPRYLHRRLPSVNEAIEIALASNHKRVLWVVNNIDRCQAIADELEHRLGKSVLSYHSRFTLHDRQILHNSTVAAFQQQGQAAIAVTTQVCEMSLDLDAEVLITEDAPVPSLVQRMGRANRHLAYDYSEVYTYSPETSLPYQGQELHEAIGFLEAIGDRRVSQAELAGLLLKHSNQVVKASNTTSFISSGYFAIPGSIRDAEEYALPCILNRPNELVEVQQLIKIRKPIDGFVVNVPRPDKRFPELNENRPAWLPRHLFIADHRHYDTKRGFRKERINE
jgi:CRISPR-associated endonuclease/helicase Cas3